MKKEVSYNPKDPAYLDVNTNILRLTKSADCSLFIALVLFRSNNKRKYCSATNKWISDYLSISEMSVKRMLNKLKDLDLIQSELGTYMGKIERKITLTEKCKSLLKITKENMENLDDSIFSDKPIEQKQTKDIGSIIKPTQRVLEPEMEAFEKIRKAYYQPRISNKKKEYKLYLELSKEERLLAFINLEQYLELNKDNHDFISSLANYLESKKFSNENIEFLKKIKNKPKKDKNTSETKLTSDQWKTKYLD